jgi:hypothetical protein
MHRGFSFDGSRNKSQGLHGLLVCVGENRQITTRYFFIKIFNQLIVTFALFCIHLSFGATASVSLAAFNRMF